VAINYKEWNEQLLKARKSESHALALYLWRIVNGILKTRGLEVNGFDREGIAEVAMESTRDHQRLLIYQSGKVDTVKFAAYVSFWFRKVQPLWRGCKAGSSATTKPRIKDINERVALYLLADLIEILDKGFASEIAQVRKQKFEAFFETKEFDYVVKSMRHRTFGPHHLVILANSLLEPK
jgi:hypothetical protein